MMRVNQEEIPGISDASPLTERQKKISRKRPLSDLLEDVPPCSNYMPLHVQERDPHTNLPDDVDSNSPIDLYNLFITSRHRELIAKHTNIKANKELQEKSKENRRPWYDTNEAEIGVFLGILLLMGLDHSPAIENYWTNDLNKPIYIAIQRVMSLRRFQQIKRFLKISNPLNEPDSSGPDWWKKLEPLVTEFQKASQEYYRPGPHVSVDEQLILFKGRSKHTMQMVAKEAGQGFKIYSLCGGNYLLAFLFASKVRLM